MDGCARSCRTAAADLAGIQPGDLLKTINGNPVRDLVDYQFYASDEELTARHRPQRARPRGAGRPRRRTKRWASASAKSQRPSSASAPTSASSASSRACRSATTPQRGLPLGMRDTLYIKDDDYRYSFLFGNFITLTNLKEHDWRRLEEQRLSPLYVSVHTTNPELRRKMVDGPRSGEILDQIERLGGLGITCHTQLVLCPEHQRWRRARAQHRRSGRAAPHRRVDLGRAGRADEVQQHAQGRRACRRCAPIPLDEART